MLGMPRRKSISLQQASKQEQNLGTELPPTGKPEKQKTDQVQESSQMSVTDQNVLVSDIVTEGVTVVTMATSDMTANTALIADNGTLSISESGNEHAVVTMATIEDDSASREECPLQVVEFIEEVVDPKQGVAGSDLGKEVTEVTEVVAPGAADAEENKGDESDPKKKLSLEALFEAAHSELQNMSEVRQISGVTGSLGQVQGQSHVENVRLIALPVGANAATLPLTVVPQQSGVAAVQPGSYQAVTVIKPELATASLSQASSQQQQQQQQQPVNVTLVQTPTAIKPGVCVVYAADGATQLRTIQQEAVPSTAGRKRKHPQKPGKHICPYCSKGCTKPSVLQKHIRAHTGERPYPCTPCGISFKTKSNLYKHCKSRAHYLRAGIATCSEDGDTLVRQASTASSLPDDEEMTSDLSDNEEATSSSSSKVMVESESNKLVRQTSVVQTVRLAAEGKDPATPQASQTPTVFVTDKKFYDVVYINKDGTTTSTIQTEESKTETESAGSFSSSTVVTQDTVPQPVVVLNQANTGTSSVTSPSPARSTIFSLPSSSVATYVLASPLAVTTTVATPSVSRQTSQVLTTPLAVASKASSIATPSAAKRDDMTPLKLTSTIEKYADKSMKVTIQLPKPVTTLAPTLSSSAPKDLTPEKVGERISWLISNNAAIVDTPMADAPRPKRVSRQNSEPQPSVAQLQPLVTPSQLTAPPGVSLGSKLFPTSGLVMSEVKSPGVQPATPSFKTVTVVHPNSDTQPKPQQHFLDLAEPSDQPPGSASEVAPPTQSSTSPEQTAKNDDLRPGGVAVPVQAPEEIKIQFHLPKPGSESADSAPSGNIHTLEGSTTPGLLSQPMIGQPNVQFPGQPIIITRDGQLVLKASPAGLTRQHSTDVATIKDLLLRGKHTAPSTPSIVLTPSVDLPGTEEKLATVSSPETGNGGSCVQTEPSGEDQYIVVQQDGGYAQGQYVALVGQSVQPKRGRPKGSKNRPKLVSQKSTSDLPPDLKPDGSSTVTPPDSLTLASLPVAPSPKVLSPNERPQLKLRIPQPSGFGGQSAPMHPRTASLISEEQGFPPSPGVSPSQSASTPLIGTPTPQTGSQTPGTGGPTPDWKLRLKGRLLMKRSMSVERMLSQEKKWEKLRQSSSNQLLDSKGQQLNLLRRAESLDETAALKRRRILQHQPFSMDASRGVVAEETEEETAVVNLKTSEKDKIVITNEESGQVIVLQDGQQVIEVTPEPSCNPLQTLLSKPLSMEDMEAISSLIKQGTSLPTNIGLEVLIPGSPATAPLLHTEMGGQLTSKLALSSVLQTGNKKILSMLQLVEGESEDEKTLEGKTEDVSMATVEKESSDSATLATTSGGDIEFTEQQEKQQSQSPEVTASSPKVTASSPKVTTPPTKVITPSDEMVLIEYGNQVISVPENLQDRAVVALLLLGHSYASLRSNSHVSFCSVMKPQPMYVRQGSNKKISMYSNWKTASHNPNPMQLTCKQMLDLYRTPPSYSADPKFINSSSEETSAGLITHSSYWTYRGEDKKRQATDVRMTVFPEILKVMKNEVDATTPETVRETEGQAVYVINKPSIRKTPRHARQVGGAGSEPSKIHIFPGGYKSNEDYSYIRGRGRGKYVCEECGIRCKKPSMLKKHIRTHTDLRPFHCKHCNFSFKTKGNLTKHMKSKTHHRKCLQLGVSPIPVSVDDSQVDSGTLEQQHSMTQQVSYVTVDGVQVQQYIEEEVVEDEEVEYEELEDEEEDEMEEQEVEEEEVNSEEMVILPELPTSAAEAVPATEAGARSEVHGVAKQEGVPHSIDKEIAAASLLDLSKGHKQPGNEVTEEGVAEEDGTEDATGFRRLDTLIGALRSRTKPTTDSDDRGVKTEHGTASDQLAAKFLKQMGAIPKVIAFPASATNFKFTEAKSEDSVKVTGSGFVPPLFFTGFSALSTPTSAPLKLPVILPVAAEQTESSTDKNETDQTTSKSFPHSPKGQSEGQGQESEAKGQGSQPAKSQEPSEIPVQVIQLPGSSETITIPNLTGLHGMPAVVPSQIPVGVKLVTASVTSDRSGVKFVTGDSRAPYEIIPIPGKVNDNPDDLVDGKYVCNVCNKSFNKQHQLTIHKNIHFFERPWKCDDCSLSFRNKGHLDRHLRSESHVSKQNTRQHVGVVTSDNPRPFKCLDCDIAFRIYGHLAKHLRSKAHVMSLEKYGKVPPGTYAQIEKAQYKTPTGEDGDPSLDTLQQLIENSSSTATTQPEDSSEVSDPTVAPDSSPGGSSGVVSAPHSASTPPRSDINPTAPVTSTTDQFVYLEEYERDHVASNEKVTVEIKSEPIELGNIVSKGTQRPLEETETGEAEGQPGAHKCGICSKTFQQITTLKQHLVTHAELRPYVCEYCDAGFTRAQSLNFHLRTHTQERPYICGQCGDTFAHSEDLHQHLNMHISQLGLPLLTSPGGAAGSKSAIVKQSPGGHIGRVVQSPGGTATRVIQSLGGSTQSSQKLLIGVPPDLQPSGRVLPPLTLTQPSVQVTDPSSVILQTVSPEGTTSTQQVAPSTDQNLEVIQVNADHVEMQEMVQIGEDGVEQKVQMLILHTGDHNSTQTAIIDDSTDITHSIDNHQNHQVVPLGVHSIHQVSPTVLTDSDDVSQTAKFGDVTYASLSSHTESLATEDSDKTDNMTGIRIENVINISPANFDTLPGSKVMDQKQESEVKEGSGVKEQGRETTVFSRKRKLLEAAESEEEHSSKRTRSPEDS